MKAIRPSPVDQRSQAVGESSGIEEVPRANAREGASRDGAPRDGTPRGDALKQGAPKDAQEAPQGRPTGEYLALIALYNGVLGSALLAAKRTGRLPERPRIDDLALAALATQRLSRLVTKDRVTSAMRAPFTTYQGEGGPGEVEDAARGRGLRRVLGELLVCPFCIAQWIAGAFGCGWLFAPRATRFLASTFSVVALADLLQLAYAETASRLEE